MSSTSSMNATTEPSSRSASKVSASTSASRSAPWPPQARRLDLHEGPAQTRGDALGERRFAGSRRPEENDRLRRSDRVARSQLRLGQRQDDSTLDEFLRGLQALQLLPQTRPHEPPTEALQRPWCSQHERQLTLH